MKLFHRKKSDEDAQVKIGLQVLLITNRLPKIAIACAKPIQNFY